MICKKVILKIAGGNTTALIYNCPVNERNKISKKYLKVVEQVGFVSYNGEYPGLIMMGEELCINGTIALASQLSKKGKLFTSGIKEPVDYFNENGKTIIKIPTKYKRDENIILFEGIGYKLIENKGGLEINKELVSKLADKYNLPAFGLIVYEKNKITPYIYVKEVDSFVKETACGSGSIAFSIFSRYNKIVQPTGESIYVKIGKDIEVGAEVNKETLLNTQELNKLKEGSVK